MHIFCIGSGSSPRALRQNATSHVTAKHPSLSPQPSTVQTSTTRPVQAVDTCEDEDIYTLPGPPMSKPLTAKSEVEYYNIPSSKNQPPCTNRAENQSTGATSLVTGSSSKTVKATSTKKPAITPKPTNKGNQGMKNTVTQYTQCHTVNFVEFATETATFNVVSGIATTRPPVLRDGVVM